MTDMSNTTFAHVRLKDQQVDLCLYFAVLSAGAEQFSKKAHLYKRGLTWLTSRHWKLLLWKDTFLAASARQHKLGEAVQ